MRWVTPGRVGTSTTVWLVWACADDSEVNRAAAKSSSSLRISRAERQPSQSRRCLDDLGERHVHRLAMLLGEGHHFICAGRCATDAQAAVALGDQLARDRMKDLVGGSVADARGASVLDERQRIPLAEDRKMTGTKQ